MNSSRGLQIFCQHLSNRLASPHQSSHAYTQAPANVQLSWFHFNLGGLSNGCRPVLLNIDPLYIKTLHVWRTQILLCPAEKVACFCFSSSPSFPLQQLSMSHLPPSRTNTQARTITLMQQLQCQLNKALQIIDMKKIKVVTHRQINWDQVCILLTDWLWGIYAALLMFFYFSWSYLYPH